MRKSYYLKSLFYLTRTRIVIVRASPPFPRVHVEALFPSSSLFWAFSYSTDTAIGTSKEQSFTVNYLINTCGFSPESALSASEYVFFHSSQKPDSVLALFSNLGFSDSQSQLIIRKRPRLLVSNPTKTLLPKLQFLRSKCASSSQLSRIVTVKPVILQRSLQNRLIPNYNLLNSLLQSDQRTIVAIQRCANLLCFDGLQHNIMFLLDAGVRKPSMAMLLRQWPSLITYSLDYLSNKVDEIREMGIDPSKATFVPAMYAKVLPKSMWESKVDLYKKWRWTDETIHEAFVRHPFCMLISKRKIAEGLDFFVNHIGWDPQVLVTYPILLSLSLKKRIIPRASVLEFLQSRDLIKNDRYPHAYLFSEDMFLQKYVNCFEDQAPQLLKLYEEKMNLSRMDKQWVS